MTRASTWTVRPDDWPPVAHVKPPYSLSRVEVARSCPLRVVFEASKQYEPRLSFDARIGTAMHNTLEHFARFPPQGEGAAVMAQVRQQFEEEIGRQRQEALKHPREQNLPEHKERIDAALLAVLRDIKAGEQAARGMGRGAEPSVTEVDGRTIWVERAVHSEDGMFVGRVDRAVRDGDHLTLYDYKSSMLPSVPERYARQLQMYTELWETCFGERPTRAVVVYPLLDIEFNIDVSVETTRAAMNVSHEAVAPLQGSRPAEILATPGDVCHVCSYKPWCEPFWQWVGEGSLPTSQERSALGFQGEIRKTGRFRDYLTLEVAWHPRSVGLLLVPWNALPHLHACQPGQKIRVIGAKMTGQVTAPRAVWAAGTEIYVLEP